MFVRSGEKRRLSKRAVQSESLDSLLNFEAIFYLCDNLLARRVNYILFKRNLLKHRLDRK